MAAFLVDRSGGWPDDPNDLALMPRSNGLGGAIPALTVRRRFPPVTHFHSRRTKPERSGDRKPLDNVPALLLGRAPKLVHPSAGAR